MITAVLIIFPVILQTVINLIMLSVGGWGIMGRLAIKVTSKLDGEKWPYVHKNLE